MHPRQITGNFLNFPNLVKLNLYTVRPTNYFLILHLCTPIIFVVGVVEGQYWEQRGHLPPYLRPGWEDHREGKMNPLFTLISKVPLYIY